MDALSSAGLESITLVSLFPQNGHFIVSFDPSRKNPIQQIITCLTCIGDASKYT
jgi:hypothetical protein